MSYEFSDETTGEYSDEPFFESETGKPMPRKKMFGMWMLDSAWNFPKLAYTAMVLMLTVTMGVTWFSWGNMQYYSYTLGGANNTFITGYQFMNSDDEVVTNPAWIILVSAILMTIAWVCYLAYVPFYSAVFKAFKRKEKEDEDTTRFSFGLGPVPSLVGAGIFLIGCVFLLVAIGWGFGFSAHGLLTFCKIDSNVYETVPFNSTANITVPLKLCDHRYASSVEGIFYSIFGFNILNVFILVVSLISVGVLELGIWQWGQEIVRISKESSGRARGLLAYAFKGPFPTLKWNVAVPLYFGVLFVVLAHAFDAFVLTSLFYFTAHNWGAEDIQTDMLTSERLNMASWITLITAMVGFLFFFLPKLILYGRTLYLYPGNAKGFGRIWTSSFIIHAIIQFFGYGTVFFLHAFLIIGNCWSPLREQCTHMGWYWYLFAVYILAAVITPVVYIIGTSLVSWGYFNTHMNWTKLASSLRKRA